MKKYTAFFVCYLAAFLTAAAVSAQQGGFNGPSGTGNGTFNGQGNGQGNRWQAQAMTVNQLNSVTYKAYVTLTGNITQSLGREYYTFRDSTGQTNIEIEWKAWQGQTVSPSDRVVITAEVERKRDGRIKVEAKSIRRL